MLVPAFLAVCKASFAASSTLALRGIEFANASSRTAVSLLCSTPTTYAASTEAIASDIFVIISSMTVFSVTASRSLAIASALSYTAL